MARPSTAAVRLLSGDREPVLVATTTNITLSGLQTIDAVVLAAGDRVLVKDQTDATENGIYEASSGTWYRAADARSSRAINKGVTVHVQSGTVGAGQVFAFQTLDPDIGEDDISIALYLSDDFAAEALTLVTNYLAQITNAGQSILDSVTNPVFTSKFAAEAYDPATAPGYILLMGLNAVGDGGGGNYKKVVSEPSHAGKFQIAEGSWYEFVPDGFSVRGEQFGVFGDGGEYSEELQNAFDFCFTADRSLELVLPAGLIQPDPANLPITADYATNIRGAGAAQRGLGAAETGGTKIYANSNTATVFQVRTRNACSFKDFTIQKPNASTAGASIDLAPDNPAGVNANNGSRFENLHFIGSFYHIKLTECAGYTVRDCSGWNAGTGGASIVNFNNAAAPDSGDAVIENNTFWGFNVIDANAAILIQAGSGLIIKGNKILAHNTAVKVRAINGTSGVAQIVDNNIEQSNDISIDVEQAVNGSLTGQFTILGNHISYQPKTGDPADDLFQNAIRFQQGITSTYIGGPSVIANNQINIGGGDGANGKAVVYLLDGANVTCIGNAIQGNNTTGMLGFSVGGFATKVKLIENPCDGCPGGVYDAMSSAVTVVDHVNGITVAQLGSWANGSVVYVSDGLINVSPVTGSSTGAIAKRLNGAWRSD